ncbi:MAG: hypothetical protein HQL06_11965 [Nitrospirae bacterium]|nr:hypothetical protein [Nitrospirota bacterium]
MQEAQNLNNISEAFSKNANCKFELATNDKLSEEHKANVDFMMSANSLSYKLKMTDNRTNHAVNADKADKLLSIQQTTIYLDMYLNVLYYKLMDILRVMPISNIIIYVLDHLSILIDRSISSTFTLIPRHLDYLFFLYFVLLWFLLNFLSRYKLFGIASHRAVRRSMMELNDSINASVTKDSGTDASVGKHIGLFFKLFSKQSKLFPRADAREIEKQLIDVLNEIERIPKLIRRPEFIFIFDELDKIEPHINTMEKEEANTSAGAEDASFVTQETSHRQRVILKILSNLKYFFTTAKAKFIFIAGREMYDASLADVSDRNYFVGSIFHEVINVNSFLSDTSYRKTSDITNMTEQYVCRYLIPQDYIDKTEPDITRDYETYSLKTYQKYLTENLLRIEENSNDAENDAEAEIQLKRAINKNRIEKLVITVHNFIIYLTYRSNGSPKKLTRYFEKHIVSPKKHELGDSKNLCAGRHSENMYLEFGFYEQYTIGLVTFIATPIILSVNKTIKDFSDKISVSTAFIVDQIYKFHRHAFSWRNLEVTPEIIDTHKAPELRELIERIMQFLSKNNIHEILSGPYIFRFIKKMADEISFLSKISERESAAFNFTLDESLSLKGHYKARLKRLEVKYSTYVKSGKDSELVSSISFVHMVLGELHFYDEEYHDAIIELLESIQQLKHIDLNAMDIQTFYTYIRAMTLLGLAYEKGKAFSSAFTTYGKLTSDIVTYRRSLDTPLRALLLPLFEGIRLIHQPFLAKLQIIEKRSLNGITYSDIAKIEEEFRIVRSKNAAEKFLVRSEFLCKLGDILYYKNGLVPDITDNESRSMELDLREKSYCLKNNYCSQNSPIAQQPIIRTNDIKKLKFPCRACEYYMRSLEVLCKNYLGIIISGKNTEEYLVELLNTFVKDDDKQFVHKKSIVAKAIGNVLSNIGDTFLSCMSPSTPQELLEHIQDNRFLALLESIYKDSINVNSDSLKIFIDYYKDAQNKLYEIFIFYYASALFFITARMHKEYSFQFSKILFLIQECLNTFYNNGFNNDLIYKIGSSLIKRILQGIYRSYENAHRLEINRLREMFDGDLNSIRFNNYSISGDIKEVIVRYYEIKLRCDDTSDFALKDNFVSPYTTIYTMRNRIIELRLKANMNENLFIDLANPNNRELSDKYWSYRLVGKRYDPKYKGSIRMGFDKLFRRFSNNSNKITNAFGSLLTPQLVIEYLITDSIFCLCEIIKTCKTYGFSYDINHSLIAQAHLRLAIWCDYYNAYRNIETKIKDKLELLIGPSEMINIDPIYQYEMARYHCLCAIETHSERKAYKQMIDTMYYLNDDFNDSLYHFSAAIERFRLNIKQIEEMITITKERTQPIDRTNTNTQPEDDLFDYRNYYPRYDNNV